MNRQMLTGILIGAVVISGCVSVDGTRAQLSSTNESDIKKGEETIYTIATTGRDSSGFIQFQTPQQVEYVQLTSNQDLLLRIIDDAYKGEVIAAATERLDFSAEGTAYAFVQQRFGKLGRVDEERKKALKEQIISKLTQEELLDLIGDTKTNEERFEKMMSDGTRGGRSNISSYMLGYDDRDMLLNRLIATTDSPEILWRMLEGDIHISSQRRDVELRLLSMLDKVTDEQMIEKMLSEYNQSGMRLVDKSEQQMLLLKKLPESKMVALACKSIENHSVYDWNKGDLVALETGIGITTDIKDTKSLVKIVSEILAKIARYRKYCKESWTMSWGKEDEEKAQKLIAKLPELSDISISALVCLNDSNWKYLIDKVSEASAYNILSKGKATSGDLEVALVKKLSTSKVDMKVFDGVKTEAGKKAVMAAMPDEIKKEAQESTANAVASVMEKANEAKRETFEMHGFYLGMDWDDMKLVLAHHFPDYEIRESRDGDGKDAAYVIYITKQSTPFCYASAKDKKIYQFNFGKQVLKKWYKYDVQTFMEWAQAYSRETGIDMKYKMLEKETTVYELDMSTSYKVWFHQESYQYKHNTKEYRLTYFGEEKEYTYHGGLGGALIKEQAAKDFRYIRDNPGTLRARIERD